MQLVWGAEPEPVPRAGLSSSSSGQGGKGLFSSSGLKPFSFTLVEGIAQCPWPGCWQRLAVCVRPQGKG